MGYPSTADRRPQTTGILQSRQCADQAESRTLMYKYNLGRRLAADSTCTCPAWVASMIRASLLRSRPAGCLACAVVRLRPKTRASGFFSGGGQVVLSATYIRAYSAAPIHAIVSECG